MDYESKLSENLVHMARLALTGRAQDVQAYIRQSIRRNKQQNPELAQQLSELLAITPTALSPLRDFGGAIVPVDADSRLPLAKSEYPVQIPTKPIFEPTIRSKLEQVVAEQKHLLALEQQGLGPTRSLLFVGPPGVGKTLSARWIAAELNRPLITLDLATVMSSFLGKTGSNIRAVLEYAKSVASVLLLDEFDSIAKRRDDDGDVGELKRLVTVILQEVDDWPSSSLLIAATNHGDLLDPAIWRRFDDVLEYSAPSEKERGEALLGFFGEDANNVRSWLPLLVRLWAGQSFSDLNRTIQWVRRRAAITDLSASEVLVDRVSADLAQAPQSDRKAAAELLKEMGYSDRRISQIAHTSRDTLRKNRADNAISLNSKVEE